MYKELVVSIIILIGIFGLNYITQKNTDNTVRIMCESLEIIKQDITEENVNKEIAQEHIEETYSTWEKEDNKMAYYIEHDELEKVKTALTSLKSLVDVEEYSQAVESTDKCIYILDHIHEKERFTLGNIL